MDFTPLGADLELLAADQLDLGLSLSLPVAAPLAQGDEFPDVDLMLDYLIADGQHATQPADHAAGGEPLVIGDVPTLELVFDTSRLERQRESSSYSSSDAASSSRDGADPSADADADAEDEEDSDELEHKAQERKARRRQQVATSSRRHRTRKKASGVV